MAGFPKLDPQQMQAIQALLTTRTIQQAATQSGVGERTLYRWLRDPDFRSALLQAERDVIDAATRRLSRLQGEAVDVLEGALNGGIKDPLRLRAATVTLEHLARLRAIRTLDAQRHATVRRQTVLEFEENFSPGE